MKVLLINPPTGRYIRSDRCQAPVDTRVAEPARPPMDLAYMAGALEGMGAQCLIRDYPMERLSIGALEKDCCVFGPDMAVINVTTPTIKDDLETVKLLKKIDPDILTVAKGAHFMVFDKQVLEEYESLDVAIRGEPEFTIKEIASGKSREQILGITYRNGSGVARNPDRPFLNNLDELSFPARHLLNNGLYLAPDTSRPIAFINTARGCPAGCCFCAAGMVSGQNIRMRSVSSVIRELEQCVNEFGFKDFFFEADTFTWHKDWVIDFCEQIIKSNLRIRWAANSRVDTLDEERLKWMKKAGCYIIGFGAESASQALLDKMHKKIVPGQIERAVNLCNRYGVESFLVFVVGLPWETKETANETEHFVKKSKASFIEVNVAYPLPGTEFYRIARENNLFDEGALFGHNYSFPLVRSFALSTPELAILRKRILRTFYFRPGYIAKRIFKVRSFSEGLNYCRRAMKLTANLFKT